jgi:hypothetical protein
VTGRRMSREEAIHAERRGTWSGDITTTVLRQSKQWSRLIDIRMTASSGTSDSNTSSRTGLLQAIRTRPRCFRDYANGLGRLNWRG